MQKLFENNTVGTAIMRFKFVDTYVYSFFDSFKKLLQFASKDIKFLFNDTWYIQKDGVSMGSPIASSMATIFMNHVEEQMINYAGNLPTFYRRYVDDIFLIFENQCDCQPFYDYMNSIHPSIKFTFESENCNELPFLDVKVFRKDRKYFTTQYFKPTDTGLYLTPYSICDDKYKDSLVKTLISCTWEISSNYKLATKNIDIMKNRLLKNGYTENHIDKNIKKVVENKIQPRQIEKEDDKEKKIIFKIQYGKGSKQLSSSIKDLLPKNNKAIQVIYETKRIGSYLSTKCKTPKECKANLVYQFKCHGCDTRYIGQTKRHLRTRVGEHRQRSRESAIKDHALICDSRNQHINLSEFTVIKDGFDKRMCRRFYESICIKGSTDQLLNTRSKKKAEELAIFV